MTDEFYRIKRLPPYVIAEVNAMRHGARQAGRDIIDLGMGNPDLPPPQHVIDKLCESRASPARTAIRSRRASPGYAAPKAGYYARRFGVELDPRAGSGRDDGLEGGLASLATAITAPGRRGARAEPELSDPYLRLHHRRATIRSVPTTPDENYWRALDRAMAFTVPRPSILVVNYPSNPTAEAVDLAFYERLVAWAKENGVWVISDLAYSELYYDGNPTPSILQVPGGKDVRGRVHQPEQDLLDGGLADRLSRSAIAS
jgi:alanine-synthesizing transaminase